MSRSASCSLGERRFAALLEGDTLRPLEGVAELGRETPAEVLADPPLSDERVPLADVTLRPVIPHPGKIVCVGLNYRAHVEEGVYPADPPKVEEIIAVMRAAGNGAHGQRLRGLIVILWRAGLRIQEALALTEADLDPRRGSLLVRRGKGGRRREVGMDDWGWQELQPWLELRIELPVGPLFCVISGTTGGQPWATAAARAQLRRTAAAAGVRRRFAPHQLRHARAVEMAREGVPLIVIQRQLGHSNLGITSIYLQGIDNAEIIETVHARRAPMVPVSASLRL